MALSKEGLRLYKAYLEGLLAEVNAELEEEPSRAPAAKRPTMPQEKREELSRKLKQYWAKKKAQETAGGKGAKASAKGRGTTLPA